MESSANNKDLVEPGLRKKKKRRMEMGENSRYDADRADSAYSKASDDMARDMSRRMGIKRGKK